MGSNDQDRLARASARYGDPMLATDGLLGFLAGHGLSPAELDDERLHDLAMAWACALGSESAVTAFWDAYAELVRSIGARVLPGEALDDFRQHVFTHLLVRRGEAPPRIGYYGGRGPLRAFVRMVASRGGDRHATRRRDRGRARLGARRTYAGRARPQRSARDGRGQSSVRRGAGASPTEPAPS